MEETLVMRTKQIQEDKLIFETIVNNILGGVQIFKLDNLCTLLYINTGFTAITGYTQEDIDTAFNGKFLLLIHPDDRAASYLKMSEQLKTTGSFSLEYRLLHKNSKTIWVLNKGSFLPENNFEHKIQSVLTDITEQKNQQTALLISEKRYEIAMQASGLTMFEYNILTKELILFESTAKMYGVKKVIPNGAETFVKQGIIEPDSAVGYYEMYRQIHDGVPFSQCYINSRDVNGQIHNFQLMLTNVFDDTGKPIRAIGVRKNVSQIMQLQKENEFIKNLTATKTLFLEANLSQNKILYLHTLWAERSDISLPLTYIELVQTFIKIAIFYEHQTLVRQKLSIANIIKCFELGENMFSFNFKSNHETNEYLWYKYTINIIKDINNGNLTIRLYYENIHKNKLRKQQLFRERSFYENMFKKSLFAYEINITKNNFTKGHENWYDLYNINLSGIYDTMLVEFISKTIHPKDVVSFTNTFDRNKIYKLFLANKQYAFCEYRKLNSDKNYQWLKATLHIYKDPETDDISGFVYVEDIDQQKRTENLLKHNAEHDIMTDLYNKATIQEKIKTFLSFPDKKNATHAFFIIDIDYFKNINDTFGHIYGDEVLKEIAQKLRSIFRDDDIIGRFGGDEFCIFMKNISMEAIITAKAQSICNNIQKTYTDKDKSASISASIGVSLYKHHGKNYEELYSAADIALYKSKHYGRNCYTIYTI